MKSRCPTLHWILCLQRGAKGTRRSTFRESDGAFSGWSRCKERLDERCGVKDWTLHDIRRSVATGMGELGVKPHIVEAVLNHVSGARRGVAGIYIRAKYAAAKGRPLMFGRSMCWHLWPVTSQRL